MTYVNVDRYVQAEHAATGHGSPKSPRLRRGHIRYYDDGSTTWVRDCLVKMDAAIAMQSRDRYEVTRKPT